MEIGNNKIETIDGKMLWTPKEPTTATETVQMTRDFLFEGGYTSLAAEYPYQYTRKCSDGTTRLIFSKHPLGKPPAKYRIPENESIKEKLNKYLDENSNRYIYQDLLGEDWYFSDLDVFDELRDLVNKEEDKYETR